MLRLIRCGQTATCHSRYGGPPIASKASPTFAHGCEWREPNLLEAVGKALETVGYKVEKQGHKIWNITKDNRTQKIAVRTSRNRWIGSPATGGALRRSDIAAFAIGTVNSPDNPVSVEVYLIQRTEMLRRFEEHRAAGYAGRGPNFIALDKMEGTIGVGSGVAEQFPPIAKIQLGDRSADRANSADDVQVVAGIGSDDGVDRFKQDVTASAAKWLSFGPTREVKIAIYITINVA
jgi:hypothetical protein